MTVEVRDGRAPRYVDQWRRASAHVSQPYRPDLGEELLAFLCNRHFLHEVGWRPAELLVLDDAFAQALSQASEAWTQRVDRWAGLSGFAAAPWWVSLRTRAAMLAGEALTAADTFTTADLWIRSEGLAGHGAAIVGHSLSLLLTSLATGLRETIAAGMGLEFRHNGRYGELVSTLSKPEVVAVLPGSTHLGLRLPRVPSGSGTDDACGQSPGTEALSLYLQAIQLCSEAREPGAVHALGLPEGFGERVIGSIERMRNVLPSEGGALSFDATCALERTSARLVRRGRRPRKRSRWRQTQIMGCLTAFDVRLHTVTVDAHPTGQRVRCEYSHRPDLFGAAQAVQLAGRSVHVMGSTTDDRDPPVFLKADEIYPIGPE